MNPTTEMPPQLVVAAARGLFKPESRQWIKLFDSQRDTAPRGSYLAECNHIDQLAVLPSSARPVLPMAPVRMEMIGRFLHRSNDAIYAYYVGQCPSCQNIIWGRIISGSINASG